MAFSMKEENQAEPCAEDPAYGTVSVISTLSQRRYNYRSISLNTKEDPGAVGKPVGLDSED